MRSYQKEITPEPDDIYEGIYTFKDNIEERFVNSSIS